MILHLHHLTGCSPTPLAAYLKALGLLRILGQQKDATARGWWQDEHFCLLTSLDREGLERFFLEEYSPTPVLSPWNRGSGFYTPGDPALLAVESSRAQRFEEYRTAIAAARAPLHDIAAADAVVRSLKDRTKARKGMTAAEKEAARALKGNAEFRQELAEAERRFKRLKAGLLEACLLSWRGRQREWMDAAVVVREDDRPAWPSLLGTGGADGRLDFTNNCMSRLGDLFDLSSPDGHARSDASGLLRDALWAEACNTLTEGAPIGQFLPGSAGGANSTTGPEGNSLVNAWDFVLMLEGSVLFGARTSRILDAGAANHASAPFAVQAGTAGIASAGDEGAQRGEQWMPLWSRPASGTDLAAMLAEGRVQLGRRLASRPVDAARAVARLGAARGVTTFTRFGYLERNGRSNLAVPLGRVDVIARPQSRLIDDLAEWMARLDRLVRRQAVPARLVAAARGLGNAVFNAVTHDAAADRWQAVLAAASDVEAIEAGGTGFEAGPIPRLRPDWLRAAADGTPEWRLACALGSAAAAYDRFGHPCDPVRHHAAPLEDGRRARFLVRERRLVRDVRVVMTGRDPAGDLIALVERRLVEAASRGERRLPLVAARGWEADPGDLALVISGQVDLARVVTLARALMAVEWERAAGNGRVPAPSGLQWPDEPWLALRLACLPWPLPDGRAIHTDEAMVRRLGAGDGAGAVDIALRRLGAAGLRSPLRAACSDARTARLQAAALAFPVSRRTAQAMARKLEQSHEKE